MAFHAENCVSLGDSVEYSLERAAIPIDDMIEALNDAKFEGAEWVVMRSGNVRGAKWAKIDPYYEFLEEDEDD